jgi:hypothetical protein
MRLEAQGDEARMPRQMRASLWDYSYNGKISPVLFVVRKIPRRVLKRIIARRNILHGSAGQAKIIYQKLVCSGNNYVLV